MQRYLMVHWLKNEGFGLAQPLQFLLLRFVTLCFTSQTQGMVPTWQKEANNVAFIVADRKKKNTLSH